MITKIEIDGFKSFKDFSVTFTPFTVIAGLNASGKSNLFDALELLSRLSTMSLNEAFSVGRGTIDEFFSMVGSGTVDKMRFAVEMLVDRDVKDSWGAEAEIKSPRLRYALHIRKRELQNGFEELVVEHETLSLIKASEDKWVKTYMKDCPQLYKSYQHGGSRPFIQTNTNESDDTKSIYIRQDGGRAGRNSPANTIGQTVLSGVNSVDYPHVFAAKMEMFNWKFLQLNPEQLRKPTEMNAATIDTITSNGSNLAAALYRLKEDNSYTLLEISREITRFLPDYIEIDVFKDDVKREFLLSVKNREHEWFSSRVLSEGTLRIIALIIMKYDNKHRGLLCFEEPENGIHLQRIKQMKDLLHDLSADYNNPEAPLRQVIVNTHSPILIMELNGANHGATSNTSVYLSKMVTNIFDYRNDRIAMRSTKFNRMKLDGQNDLFLSDISDPLSIADLAYYLGNQYKKFNRTEHV